jgi:hypothetical protein
LISSLTNSSNFIFVGSLAYLSQYAEAIAVVNFTSITVFSTLVNTLVATTHISFLKANVQSGFANLTISTQSLANFSFSAFNLLISSGVFQFLLKSAKIAADPSLLNNAPSVRAFFTLSFHSINALPASVIQNNDRKAFHKSPACHLPNIHNTLSYVF